MHFFLMPHILLVRFAEQAIFPEVALFPRFFSISQRIIKLIVSSFQKWSPYCFLARLIKLFLITNCEYFFGKFLDDLHFKSVGTN